MSVISLTTDFGLNDWFVGTMKGVILSIRANARIVDLTHGVPAGDIRAGAFALAAGCRFFPSGTVHVAVVDPGVGSERAAIAVRTRSCFFLGPDNGVLSLALRSEEIVAIHRLENHRYFRDSISNTFHGRDVFAPVAAHLSRGLSIGKLGPKVSGYVKLGVPECSADLGTVVGEVAYLDRFGNGITNIPESAIPRWTERGATATVGTRSGVPLVRFYQEVARGKPLALVGSTRFLEIAISGGNAAEKLSLRRGTRVKVKLAAVKAG